MRSLFLAIALLSFAHCAREKGCNDPTSLNFNPDAESNDGSCIYELAQLPDTYTFSRQQSSSVSYERETLTQLRINDLYLLLKSLGNAGAAPLDTNRLAQLYSTADNQTILSPVGSYTPLQTNYNDLSSTGLILKSRVSIAYQADSMILAWIDTITYRAQQPNYIGSTAVYTTADGIDLAEMIHKTLLGAVLYSQGISQLNSLLNANNTNLVSNTNYTAMEHQWDAIAGLFGFPVNYASYTPNITYADDNNDNSINYTTEYAYTWANDAIARTVAAPDTDFRTQLFNAFIEGRAAITSKNDTLRIQSKDKIMLLWEQLAVANLVHHANNLLSTLKISTGTQDPNLPQLNAHWAALRATCLSLRCKTDNNLANHLNTLIAFIGNLPPHAAAGTPENIAYQNNIEHLKQLIANNYDFSEVQMQNW